MRSYARDFRHAMRLRFMVFGYEVCALELQQQDVAGVLAEAIAEYADGAEAYQTDTEPHTIGGGSAHNFERDLNPVSPDDRYEPWEDRGFGFGR